MQNELPTSSKPLKEKTTKTERCALQESQRAAKAAAKGQNYINFLFLNIIFYKFLLLKNHGTVVYISCNYVSFRCSKFMEFPFTKLCNSRSWSEGSLDAFFVSLCFFF